MLHVRKENICSVFRSVIGVYVSGCEVDLFLSRPV